jgi:hypothetical protein
LLLNIPLVLLGVVELIAEELYEIFFVKLFDIIIELFVENWVVLVKLVIFVEIERV